jgi:hypothetical protein
VFGKSAGDLGILEPFRANAVTLHGNDFAPFVDHEIFFLQTASGLLSEALPNLFSFACRLFHGFFNYT